MMARKIYDKDIIEFIKEGYKDQKTLLRSFWRRGKGNWRKNFVLSDEGNDPKEWTKLSDNVFKKNAQIAEGFGCRVEKEEGMYLERPKRKFRRLDYVWYNENDEAIVVIESENRQKFDVVKSEEWPKLLKFKSNYKILIFYKQAYEVEDWNKIIYECQKSIDNNPKLEKECFIIITMWRYQVSKETHWRIVKLRKGKKEQKESVIV